MIVYRIRHKETGLFYTPSSGYGLHKCNLNKIGKVYARKPSLKHIGHYCYPKGKLKEFIEDEFEIVEYILVETDKET